MKASVVRITYNQLQNVLCFSFLEVFEMTNIGHYGLLSLAEVHIITDCIWELQVRMLVNISCWIGTSVWRLLFMLLKD